MALRLWFSLRLGVKCAFRKNKFSRKDAKIVKTQRESHRSSISSGNASCYCVSGTIAAPWIIGSLLPALKNPNAESA